MTSTKHILIVGRIPGDDEDSHGVFQVDNRVRAIGKFIEQLYEEDDQDRADVTAKHGTDIVITGIFESDTAIKAASGGF